MFLQVRSAPEGQLGGPSGAQVALGDQFGGPNGVQETLGGQLGRQIGVQVALGGQLVTAKWCLTAPKWSPSGARQRPGEVQVALGEHLT